MTNDIESIDKEIAALKSRRQAVLDAQRAEKLKEIKNLIRQFGFTAAEVGLKGSTKKSRAQPKYANPADPGQTWAGGKGARPLWVREHLRKGGKLEDLAIRMEH